MASSTTVKINNPPQPVNSDFFACAGLESANSPPILLDYEELLNIISTP
jgi:hypothetical protein